MDASSHSVHVQWCLQGWCSLIWNTGNTTRNPSLCKTSVAIAKLRCGWSSLHPSLSKHNECSAYNMQNSPLKRDSWCILVVTNLWVTQVYVQGDVSGNTSLARQQGVICPFKLPVVSQCLQSGNDRRVAITATHSVTVHVLHINCLHDSTWKPSVQKPPIHGYPTRIPSKWPHMSIRQGVPWRSPEISLYIHTICTHICVHYSKYSSVED